MTTHEMVRIVAKRAGQRRYARPVKRIPERNGGVAPQDGGATPGQRRAAETAPECAAAQHEKLDEGGKGRLRVRRRERSNAGFACPPRRRTDDLADVAAPHP